MDDLGPNVHPLPDDTEVEEVQTPLVEDLTEGVVDASTMLTPVPEGLLERAVPRDETKALLDSGETLCGSPLEFTWKRGTWKGKAVRMYCAEPFCLETGRCTGAMFVPADPQYTTHDKADPLRRRREMDAEEVIAAARWSARKATGRDDPRSDTDIARFAGRVLQRLRGRLRAAGDWGA